MNLIEINDINASELDVYIRNTENQLRAEESIFVAESAYVSLRALEAGYEPLSMLVETDRIEAEAQPVFEALEKICGKEKTESIPVYVADRKIHRGY